VKKKSLLSAFLTAMIISGLILVGIVHFSTVHASTNVSGIISSDTTWTQANSPYNLTGNILVNNGITLTIEPGVTVNLNNYYIMVNGTLYAWCNNVNPIYINGGQITFTQFSTDWNESTGTGCIIENAVLSATITLNNSPKMYNDTTSSVINVQATKGMPIISNNTIKGGISVSAGGMPIISNNTFLGSGISLFLANATVSGNTISGSSAGITAYTDFSGYGWFNCTSLIEGNLIIGNGNGIVISEQQGSTMGSPIVQNNTITKNDVGIYLTWIGIAGPSPTILNNNIYNNSNYNIKSSLSNDINATYNWWGTTDTQAINQTIYDFKNDFNLGTVTFVPFLTEPNPEAPTIPTFTISASAGAGGSISPSGSVSVNFSDSQTFNITADTGYHIVDVTVDGSSVGAVSSYSFTNVQAAHTISAMFAPTPTPTPSPSPTPTPTSAPTPTTPTTSPSPSPSPTPAIPEFPSWVILPLLIMVVISVGSLIYFKKRNNARINEHSEIEQSST
jgi:hypothetical protein